MRSLFLYHSTAALSLLSSSSSSVPKTLSLSLSKFLSDGGVVVMFSIFPHFVLRNISLAGCSDVCKTVVNPFSALLDFSGCVLIYCSSVSVFCDLCFPEKKESSPSLARARAFSSPFPIIVRVNVGGDGCENYCSERGEIVLF